MPTLLFLLTVAMNGAVVSFVMVMWNGTYRAVAEHSQQ
jgi:hypothetical protein